MPFKTTWRPWRDSDQEAEITVYECRDDAPDLGIPQFLADPTRNDWWWSPQYPGIDPDVRRTALPGLTKPLALGDHRCGTEEDFRLGGVYDPISPPVQRRADGLPVCCGNGLLGEGGGMGGGSAVVGFNPCDQYLVVTPGVTLDNVGVWSWADAGATWTLTVDGPVPNTWTLTDHTTGPPTVYTATDWDGTGTAGFATGGFPPPPIQDVQCV